MTKLKKNTLISKPDKIDRFIGIFSKNLQWHTKNAHSQEVKWALEYIQQALRDTKETLEHDYTA